METLLIDLTAKVNYLTSSNKLIRQSNEEIKAPYAEHKVFNSELKQTNVILLRKIEDLTKACSAIPLVRIRYSIKLTPSTSNNRVGKSHQPYPKA
ncbi:hypothetical protein P152DRAFT_462528 [Eremomyces bilateralis CBS 781.70]|uniref:Uncharacterized protein n=1 Tax=Eremomyces bilateralis CBS 781.70 TaxID=1392243 RepID=A0A6G1FRP0_9PEZI|nr:uncharacterized protein P152DRAFT_462528 [Eremomyces bilateralis CBS 781.70]KAF1808398.1 hypothetical protein P152DRAFT_462528 [Eremomyces bilateralis CBS 781.70]